MISAWVRTVNPVLPVLTVDEAKAHARITQDNSDAVLQRYIETATGAAEDYLGRGLLTQTWQLSLSDFADVIYLPMAAPLQSVTSVTYYDKDGTSQGLSSSFYVVSTANRPGTLDRAPNQTWPVLQADRQTGRIVITYVVGWTNANLVPERIKQGIRLYVAYLDCDREGLEDPEKARMAAEACWSDRVFWPEPQMVSW